MSERTVSREAFAAALKKSYLVGPARALELLDRVPSLFAQRGWTNDPDAVAVAIGAISCVVLGADGQVFFKPPAAASIPGWPEGDSATAISIFEGLDLRGLVGSIEALIPG